MMMRRLRRFVIRLTSSATRRRDEERLRDEIEDHLARQAEDYERAGMTSSGARRQALVRFGGIEGAREQYRDAQSLPSVEALLQDFTIALRRMRQTPAFTAGAVATLALGLGVLSAILSLAYSLFLRPLPVPDASRLVLVDQTIAGQPPLGHELSYPDYLHYRDHARTVPELAAHYSTSPMQVVTSGGPANLTGAVVSANFFNVLRLRPALGRFFTTDDERAPGGSAVAIVSDDFWRAALGANPDAIGMTLRINGTWVTVVGVAPAGFRGVVQGVPATSIWIPVSMMGTGYRYCDGLARGCAVLRFVGRMADGVTVEAGQAELTGLARELETAFPDTNKGRGVMLRSARGVRLQDQTRHRPIVTMLGVAAGLVLLIAAANVAALLLSRALKRRQEIAIRLSLGAGRGRVIRLLLVESLTLAVAGSLAGLVVATWTLDVLRTFFGPTLAGAANLDLSLDPLAVIASLIAAVVTGVLTGVPPALQSTRPSTMPALKEGSPGAGRGRSRVRDGLVVVQVALSVVLLASSGLLVRSVLMLHRGPGFDPQAVVLVRLRPSLVGYSTERAWAFQRAVADRLTAMPGVAAVSVAGNPPLPGWGRRTVVRTSSDAADAPGIGATSTYVGTRYFETLGEGPGAGVLRGREFDERDRATTAGVAIVNDALARRLRPQGDVVGAWIDVNKVRYEVVGVAADRQFTSIIEQSDPTVYLNHWQQDQTANSSKDSMTHVRITRDASVMIPEIRQAIAAIDSDVPASEMLTLGDRLDYAFAEVRAARTLFVILGALGLILSTIGLYAALAFAVSQRTREIAIRMALGAAARDVGTLVARRGLAIVAMGSAIGLGAALLAQPLVAHLLYGISPHDPRWLLAGPCLLGMVALVAIWVPAVRAMRMNPVAGLRSN